MKKIKVVSKETDNARVQRMAERALKLSCPVCGPNKGCNYRRKKKGNNWKSFRNNQWRVYGNI